MGYMKIFLNGDILFFDDELFDKISNNTDIDLKNEYNFTDDYCDCCDDNSDNEFYLDENDCDMEADEYLDGMLEYYSNLIVEMDNCPDCIKTILVQFMDEILDLIEDDIEDDIKN